MCNFNTKGKVKNRFFIKFLLLFFISFLAVSISNGTVSSAASRYVKVRYNKKTHKNKSKQLTVTYNGKKISKSGYKALVIKKSYMVPYNDIFKSGTKAKVTYSKKTKKIKIKLNDTTMRMTVGKKTAYVNGKKVKLKTAPLSVYYVSKKKTKIMVPIYSVAKSLSLRYVKTSSKIQLSAPLKLTYNGATTYYTGVQGGILFNHTAYKLSSLPVLKIDGNMYFPAEEVFDQIMKLEYSYNTSNGKISVSDPDNSIDFSCTVNSNQYTLNNKTYTMKKNVMLIRNEATKQDVVCVPASAVIKALNYTYKWDKAASRVTIQSVNFFKWSKEVTDVQKQDTQKNYIYDVSASYSLTDNTGYVSMNITSTLPDILNSAVIQRNNKIITITIPTSEYLLDKNQFSNFGEIIDKFEVTKDNDSVVVTLTCKDTLDYSYAVQNNTLTINVLYNYAGSKNTTIANYSLAIPKPSGVTISKVTNTDFYANKKFRVEIQGDYVNYFTENPVVINNNKVKDVQISKASGKTYITVATTSIQGYKIYEEKDRLVVAMNTPNKIYKNIVVLDAGHGGHDPGAQNKGTNEKDLNFKIIYTLMKNYFSGNAPDTKVYWTRTSDTFITLANRAAFAKKVGADVFISLHMNSSDSSSANGTEVYYSVSNNSKSFSGLTSKTMATMFRTALLKDVGTKNRGTKTAGYYVCKHNTVPAILIELGFISGSSDYSKLTNASFQQKAATSIYNSINNLFAKYPTGR